MPNEQRKRSPRPDGPPTAADDRRGSVALESSAWSPLRHWWGLTPTFVVCAALSMVAVHYTIAAADEPAWLDAMRRLRRSRLRTGAVRWELYRDAEHPDRFVEQFRVASWQEHLRQHEGRLTALDQQVEQAAMGYSDPPVTATQLLPP